MYFILSDDISGPQALMAKAVTVGQLGVTALALAGDHIFPALGVNPPALYVQYRDRKVGVCLGAWIVGNLVQNSLTATGAFEVYSAGEKVRVCVPYCAATGAS